MSEQGRTQSAATTLTVSGANTASFYADRPILITRWGFVTTTALTTASSVLTSALVESDGTAAVPTGAAAGGVLTVTTTIGVIKGGAYIEAENFLLGRPIVMVPGERFDIVSDGGSDAGAGNVFIEFEPLPFVSKTRDATDPGATQRPLTLTNMTELSA